VAPEGEVRNDYRKKKGKKKRNRDPLAEFPDSTVEILQMRTRK